jgi:hypothetical protein
VTDLGGRRVVGFVIETYALRQYRQELECARAEELGDSTLFGPGAVLTIRERSS